MRYWLGVAAWLLVYVVVALGALLAAHAASPLCPAPLARPVVHVAPGEIRMLAALAWAEARGERDPYCAMQAVAAVVVNRMRRHPAYFGATITQVLSQPYQFTPFGSASQRRRMNKANDSDPLFLIATLAATAAVSGADPVSGALYFHSGPRPRWAYGMAVTARIGGHTFMKP